MAEFLSPGVSVSELDASVIAPTVSTSTGVFSGNFVKGPVGEFRLITSVAELIDVYGKPTNDNYNEWYQAYNFLQYGNKLYVARAANVGGSEETTSQQVASAVVTNSTDTIDVLDSNDFAVGEVIRFSGGEETYIITAVDTNLDTVTLDRTIAREVSTSEEIFKVESTLNAVAEAVIGGGTDLSSSELFATLPRVGSQSEFEQVEDSIVMASPESKIKFISKNPGSWGNNVEVAVALPSSFGTSAEAFTGVSLDGLVEYAPIGTEVAVIVRYKGEVVETFIADFDVDATDVNNKSAYIENVINDSSNYIFAKVNDAQPGAVKEYLGSDTLKLVLGKDSAIQADDLSDAYDLFDNKEYIDVDIVIGNEVDAGVSAKNLVEARKDCIGFIGVEYADVVGAKASEAVSNLVEWRKSGNGNINSMFLVACGNYKYQYDRYNDKNRWINIAGDVAGLRAATSTNRAAWWASAGLERGQIKNVRKLAFNPSQGQRDVLYKNAINPICTFPGQGTVMWGQKTLLNKPSSFDRVNVRGLFNTLERSLSKMAKYQVMEFNDNFTRNRIVSMIKPFLSSVQAGRGIQDFLVICDETNNTADVISRNQLVVDVFIKPTYVSEFIHLKFTNAGTNSFAEVIGGQ